MLDQDKLAGLKRYAYSSNSLNIEVQTSVLRELIDVATIWHLEREVHQVRMEEHARNPVKIEIDNPWLRAISDAWCAKSTRRMKEDPKGALKDLLDEVCSEATKATGTAELPDGEAEAFEQWAEEQKYDMTTHPLHWLFLNERTHAARQGWKAGRAFEAARQPAPEPDWSRFKTWLAQEMPAGTVIGDPAWWAPRIFNAVGFHTIAATNRSQP